MLFCYVSLIPVIAATVVSVMGLIHRVESMINNMAADPFAMLEQSASGKTAEVTSSALERFCSGFAMSATASMGTTALFAGLALLTPYRYRSRTVLSWSLVLQMILVVWSAVGVIAGWRPFDASMMGTLVTLLYGVPLALLVRNSTVLAWSVRYEPPPPTLPQPEQGQG